MIRLVISRADAKERGLSRYFTGKPCKHGHVAERRVCDSYCVECHRSKEAIRRTDPVVKERFRQWVKDNADHVKAYFKEYVPKYYRANAAKLCARRKKWVAENREQVLQSRKAAYQENIEKRRAEARQRRVGNEIVFNQKCKEWRAKNPDKVIESTRVRRARKIGAGGNFSEAEFATLLEKQGYKCAYCNRGIKKKPVRDHIVPLARGGSNTIENIQALCATCNSKKHATDPLKYAHRIGRLL